MIDRLRRDALRLQRWVDALAFPWWTGPGVLVMVAVSAYVAALVFVPGADEHAYVFGRQFGEECAFKVKTGLPCMQCGMTRSWMHAARLHLWRSFVYNPAGATLFWWIQAAGFVGAVRLLKRDPRAARVPHRLMLAWMLVWVVGLYLLPWLGRVFLGINPLP